MYNTLLPGDRFASSHCQPTETHKWTDAEYKAAFRMFDRDRDGTITRHEVQKVLGTLGQETTEEEMDELMGDVSIFTSTFLQDG